MKLMIRFPHLAAPTTRALIAAIALLPGALSCTTSRALLVHGTPGTTAGTLRAGPTTVRAYVTTDGVRHRYDGTVLVSGDSLRLEQPAFPNPSTIESSGPVRSMTLPRDSVLMVESHEFSFDRTLGLAGSILGGFGLLLLYGLSHIGRSYPL